MICGVAVEAQQAKKFPPIGFLGNSTAALEANLIGPFREGMRNLGYIEGQNITIEYRWAEGKYERFPELIGELVSLKVEIIVTAGTPAATAVKKVAPTIPLVMIAVGDPIGTGLIASLAQPGERHRVELDCGGLRRKAARAAARGDSQALPGGRLQESC